MLGWIFKKPVIKGLELPQTPSRPATAAPKAAPAKPTAPARKAAPVPAAPTEVIDWPARLQAALGDDKALLALAEGAAPLETKLAAVEALAGEASLKLAERRLRNQERRVHRLAKQRLTHRIAQRETADQAAALIASANALLAEEQVPINRLVELDNAWQALDAAHLDAAAQAQFTALQQRITATTLERGEQAQRFKRWSAEARQALVELQAIAREAAAGQQARALMDQARGTAQAALATAPDSPQATAMRESLDQAVQAALALDERLALLEEVLALPPDAAKPAPAAVLAASDETPVVQAEADDADASLAETPPPAAPPPPDALARWLALPPLADAIHAQALEQRFSSWQQARQQALTLARQERRSQQRAVAKEHQRAERTAQLDTLAGLLEKAEAALDEGHLGDTHQHLLAIDELLHGGASDAALRARIDAVQGRYAQLKGWQHWAGGRARDELTQQAEALAAVAGGPAEARTVKLTIKQQAEVIQDMRDRWKELDHLGGATSRALWQRFDTALKAAYEPVAAHLKALQAQREQNLLARQALVQTLGEAALPDADAGADPSHWRPVAEALEHHLTEWRKLGPVEHTVPRKAQAGLLAQWEAAVQRLQTPLQQARQVAQTARQALVARARELAAQAAAGNASRDTVPQVRDLQASWQQQARSLPLQRAIENALWSDFKTAIDSIFAARDAAFNARDAEFKAHAVEREALIQRLEELGTQTPEAQLKRTLTEVQGQWQRCGPAPRAQAAALDDHWQRALATARSHLDQSALQRWQTVCDALQTKHALGSEWATQSGDADERQARWAALPALPTAWDEALRQRAGLGPAAAAPLSVSAADQCLLQLESAWNLPSPPAHEDARRALKLQAMKAAMESRRAPAQPPRTPDELFADVLRQPTLNEEQQARLDALLQALRRRGPPG
jgi:exonuclease SbcC